MHYPTLAIAAATICLASPAAAQDGSEPGGERTVESAQRFLAETLAGGKVSALTQAKMVDGVYRPTVSGLTTEVNFFAYGEVASWTVIDRCRSEVFMTNVRPMFGDHLPKGVLYDAPAQSLQYEIDWSRVTGTGSNERPGTLNVRPAGEPPTTRSLFATSAANPLSGDHLPIFYVETAELSKRVAFAMEYLKDNCAAKSDTGF